MGKLLTREEFIKRAHEAHGDKYDYSKVDYKNTKTRVCIICPVHGEFWQTPYHHMNGRGCTRCQYDSFSRDRRDSLDDFLRKAVEVHGDKYDYSKVEYVKSVEKVCIICPEHGVFYQRPAIHISGQGCPKCGREKANKSESSTTEEFIEKAKKVHGDRYDYSKVEYNGRENNVCIICSEHGEFWQRSSTHLRGGGCQICKKETLRNLYISNTEKFIIDSKKIHGNKYDYSLVKYEKSDKKVDVICKKHGIFKIAPSHHLNGVGCPICKESKMEIEINDLLIANDINFIREYHSDLLGKLSLDFYIPDKKIAIECQGEQHFKPIKFFGGEEKFKKTIERDKRKKNICEENGVKLYYYANKKYTDDIITEKEKIIELIKGDND